VERWAQQQAATATATAPKKEISDKKRKNDKGCSRTKTGEDPSPLGGQGPPLKRWGKRGGGGRALNLDGG